MWVGGTDIHWSLMEGFRNGTFGALPDIAIGGGVRTLTGTSKMHLTTLGVDVQISKPFTLADSATLTPWLGYQRLFIFGNSVIADATPNVDAFQRCGYSGPDPQTGAPICRNKLPGGADANYDFNNNITFDPVRIHRHRGMFGMSYRYEIIYLAGQLVFDITAPKDENPGLGGSRQWGVSLEGGVFF
jgi:hypothetical protein